VPHYICPKCKQRSVDVDGLEGFSAQAPACRHCGFGFLFELQDDYYPGPTTGMVVCDQEGRVLATGRDFYELSGYRDEDLLGREVTEIVAGGDPSPVGIALEYGVRRLGERVSLKTRSGIEKEVVADLFPALDEDGGLLVALTPAN
jgi:PAS domain S-box-containing protein